MNTWTDLYSNQSNTANGTGALVNGAVGPQQSIVTSPGTPMTGAASASGAAFSLVGLGLALVLLRVLISMGGRVA